MSKDSLKELFVTFFFFHWFNSLISIDFVGSFLNKHFFSSEENAKLMKPAKEDMQRTSNHKSFL